MSKLICGKGLNDIRYSMYSDIIDKELYKKALDRWHSMIKRCYNPNDKSYKYYGAKGVYVCDEWLVFSNYLKWFLDHYIEGFQVDKDLSNSNGYSPDTCMFISQEDNKKEMHIRNNLSGEKIHSYKPFEYYETHPVKSSGFRTKCKREGVDYYDFKPTRVGDNLFTYTYSPNDKQLRLDLKNPLLKYSKIPINKYKFKEFCKRNNLDFYDFKPQHIKDNLYFYLYEPDKNQERRKKDEVKKYDPMVKHEIVPTRINYFKRHCKKYNLNYYEFEPKKVSDLLYVFIYSPEGSQYREDLDNPYKRFSILPSYRSQFKKYCKNNNMNFNDFDEVEFSKHGSHKIFKYYYNKFKYNDKQEVSYD